MDRTPMLLPLIPILKSGRGDWIRTSDPLRPRQAGESSESAYFRMICSVRRKV
jgi:hypothetical protein